MTSRLYRDEAIILRTYKLGEADRIIVMLTRHHGQVRAVAKGVRRTTSRFGARLEPFSMTDVQLHAGRTLDVVTQAEIIDPFGRAVSADYAMFTCASTMVETAERLSADDGDLGTEASPQQYLLLAGALAAMSHRRHAPGLILDSYLLRALALGGWAPSCYDCALCGAPGPRWGGVRVLPLGRRRRGRAVHDGAPGCPTLRRLGRGRRLRSARALPGLRTRLGLHDLVPGAAPALPRTGGKGITMTDVARDMTVEAAPPLHRPGLTPPVLPAASLPQHVAVVMDGNGRWANARGLPRTEGHRVGEANMLDVAAGAIEIGVKELSVYAFSTENWRRSPGEVRFIMGFARKVLRVQRDVLNSWNVRLRWIGRTPRLWKSVLHELREAERVTAHNTGLILNLCINYGGRAEIADATRAIAEDVAAGRLKASSINEKTIQRYLYSPTMRDVDLFIRTGDEQRTSNFLMWSSSYAELYFSPLAWPDFNRTELWKACEAYAGRERRYGGAVDKVLHEEPTDAEDPEDDEADESPHHDGK